MKTSFLCLLAAVLLTGCSRAADPSPVPAQMATPAPAAMGGTYTDAAGVSVAMSNVAAYSVLAPPTASAPNRRDVVLQGILPDKTLIAVSYYYARSVFPTGTGRLLLDAPVELNVMIPPDTYPTRYEMPGSETAYLDIVGVNTVSATYTGPMKPGGPNVTFTFNHLSF